MIVFLRWNCWPALVFTLLTACSGSSSPSSPGPPPSSTGASLPTISVSGRSLLIDGAPILVKGIAYAPVPIRQGPSEFLPADSRIYARDVPLLRASGANTIRTYAMIPSPDPGIVPAAEQKGLFLLLGFPLDPYYSSAVQPNQTLDAATPGGRALRAGIRDAFRQYVLRMCGSPRVLGFVASNEVTLNYGVKFVGSPRDFYTLSAELAAIPQSVCGRYLPVTTTMSDGNLSDIGIPALGTDDGAMSALAFWSVNVFRGCTFGSFFTEFAARSAKPLLVGEFGIDAFNNTTGLEDQAAQANCVGSLWGEIQTNAATPLNVGGVAFAYSDEWWKAGNPAQHDNGGFANGSFPDGMMNEEWWGMFSVSSPGGGAIDQLTARAAYARLQQAWGGPVTIVSPLGGTLRQAETVAGSFANLRSGDTIFVVVRNAAGQLYPQSLLFTVSGETGSWQAPAFFGDPGRNVGETFQYFAVVSRDAALTNQLIAIGQTGGATALPPSPFLISFANQQTVTAVRQ